MGHSFQNRSRSRSMFCTLIACGLLFASCEIAFGHARMMHSSPAAGEVTSSPPAKIELWFNELLDGKFNEVEVFPATQVTSTSHPSLTIGEPQVDPNDKTHLFVQLKPLPPGTYYVQWRVLSLDGHSAPGRFEFTVSNPK